MCSVKGIPTSASTNKELKYFEQYLATLCGESLSDINIYIKFHEKKKQMKYLLLTNKLNDLFYTGFEDKLS